MERMARKKSSDRHKPRKSVALTPQQYEALGVLARRNARPLLWEARIAIVAHLRANGLWPFDPSMVRDDGDARE